MNIEEIIFENSKKSRPDNILNEDITMEYYDTIVGNIIKDNLKTGLVANTCFVSPMVSPTGLIFTEEVTNNQYKITKHQVEPQKVEGQTNITLETLDDLKALTGSIELFENWLKNASRNKVDLKYIEFLQANAKAVSDLSLTEEERKNAETHSFCLAQKVNEHVADMNKDKNRCLKAFCILPAKEAAQSLAFANSYNSLDGKSTIGENYIGRFNNVKYFINPNMEDENVYVGLLSESYGSVIYSPYNVILATAMNSDKNEVTYFTISRFGLTLNPQSTDEIPLLVKFKIVAQ